MKNVLNMFQNMLCRIHNVLNNLDISKRAKSVSNRTESVSKRANSVSNRTESLSESLLNMVSNRAKSVSNRTESVSKRAESVSKRAGYGFEPC